METQGAYNLLFRPGLRKDFRDTWQQFAAQYPSYLKSGSMDMPEMSASIFTYPARTLEIGDGEAPTFVAPKLGPKVMGVDKEFAAGIEISRKTIEDDQYGLMRGGAKWLAHASRITREYRSAELLDDAFTGSTFKGIDGRPLVDASHTFLNDIRGLSTWSNVVAGNPELSVTGIAGLQEIFMQMKDHNGDPIVMGMDKLVIGNNVTDLHRASVIFSSAKEPYTADNQDNPIKNTLGSLNVVVAVYKTSLRSYFGISSRYNDAQFVTRIAPQTTDWIDNKTGAMLMKVRERYLIWFVDPRGWAGSNPS
jgi:Mu-like prophage major head subunit gpT